VGHLVFLVGPRGSGKTAILQRLHALLKSERPTALIQIEPITASPEILCERFLDLAGDILTKASGQPHSFDRLLASLLAVQDGAVLLLDELTELRTLTYFRGVEKPLESFLVALTKPSSPPCIATSRFPRLLMTHLESLPTTSRTRVEIVQVPPMSIDELATQGVKDAEVVISVTGGLPLHIATLLEHVERDITLSEALTQELQPGRRIEAECRATLGELLHRARGYGACKSVLAILAGEENLTLTEIARRMDRTAGSTRDYLRWLEEVELIRVSDKRFAFVDPILRVWLRLYGRGSPPTGDEIQSEIESYVQPKESAVSGLEKTEDRITAIPSADTTEALIEID
jgi:predicted AAA+ superfamily ATPase